MLPDLNANPEMLAFVQNYTDMGFFSIPPVLIHRYDTDYDCAGFSRDNGNHTDYVCQRLDQPGAWGAALVLGENIGTTITANLAALTAKHRLNGQHWRILFPCVRCYLGIDYLPPVHAVG